MSKSQYPSDYNPPERGKCEVCGCETKGWTKDWLARCPEHWQEFIGPPRQTRIGGVVKGIAS